MNNFLKFGLAVTGGYIIASIVVDYIGCGGSPFPNSNEELWDSIMIAGGGPYPHPSGGQVGGGGSRGGGSMHPGSWQNQTTHKAYGYDDFPQDPSIINQSKCTPDQLDCGMTGACLFHKTICGLGIWK